MSIVYLITTRNIQINNFVRNNTLVWVVYSNLHNCNILVSWSKIRKYLVIDQENLLFLPKRCYFSSIFPRNSLSLHKTQLFMKVEREDINRLKVVLAERKKTNKWLAEQLGKDPATVSKWCTNTSQPGLETLLEIAKCLNVDVKDLLWSSTNKQQ